MAWWAQRLQFERFDTGQWAALSDTFAAALSDPRLSEVAAQMLGRPTPDGRAAGKPHA